MTGISYPDLTLLLFAKSRFICMIARVTKSPIRLFLSILLFIGTGSVAMAQKINGDSMKNLMYNTRLPDTTRMSALLEAQRHLEHSLSIADTLQNDSLQNSILFNLATVYFQRSNFDTAIAYYLKALKWAEKVGHAELQYKILEGIGMCYSRMSAYEKSLSYYYKALAMMEEQGDTSAIIHSNNHIALAYLGKGDAPAALKALTTNLQLSKASGIFWLQGFIYLNIGKAYQELNELELAIKNYHRSLQMQRSNNNQLGEAQVLMVLARLYRNSAPDSTIILCQQALAIAQKNDVKNMVVDVAGVLHHTYEAMGKYQDALEMHKLHWNTRDRILGEEVQTSVARSEAQYEYEKNNCRIA